VAEGPNKPFSKVRKFAHTFAGPQQIRRVTIEGNKGMARKTFIALLLTLTLVVGATIPAFAASEQAASAPVLCTPVITIAGAGWGWQPGSNLVNMGVGYSATCEATATVIFHATSPDGKTVWTQHYHHVLSTVEETVYADWQVKPQLPFGDYTITFEIASKTGQTTYITWVVGVITLPLG
jgi:hypothetical protein